MTIQEAQAFISNAERCFTQAEKFYHNYDQRKIDDCIATFEIEPEWKWADYEDSVGVGNTTWEEFKEYLLESITNKDNHILNISARYENTA